MPLVWNAYHSSKIRKQTTLIKEATLSESSDEVTSTVNSVVVDHAKTTANYSIDFWLTTLKIETSSCKCQLV